MSTMTQNETIVKIANDVVTHCKSGDESVDYVDYDTKIWDKHFKEGWTSIEGDGRVYHGRDEVSAKFREWQKGVTVHDCQVEGPFIGQNGFSVIFDLDMEAKDGSFPRMRMKEVAQYTVEDGKIVKEEFCYMPMGDCCGGGDC